MSRRTVLVAGIGGAGAMALAACSGGSGGSGAATSTSTATGTTTNSDSTPGGTSPAGTSPAGTADPGSDSSSGSGSNDPGSGGSALASLDDLTVGKAVSVDLADGKPGILTRTGAGTVVCFSAICTHLGCTVKPVGSTLDCPCHGSTYNAKTGAVLGGPAPSPLPAVHVRVSGGKVVES